MIEITATRPGFARGKFKDRYGADCSIQKSSLASENCVWLGCDHETLDPTTGERCGARMHLTQELAADLIPLLEHFVATGELPPPTASPSTEHGDANG